jgi:regulatory protein
MPFGQLSLKGRALRLLAAREYSRAELERKLAARQEEPGQLRQVLDELHAKGFIDERRVLESVLHRRAQRLGAARIEQELQARGLDPTLVTEAVQSLRTSELERAREVWSRKFGQPPADPVERLRQARFLAARGFDGEVIRRLLAGPGREPT